MTPCVTVPDQWEKNYLDQLQVEPKDVVFGAQFTCKIFANGTVDKTSELKHKQKHKRSILSYCYTEKHNISATLPTESASTAS